MYLYYSANGTLKEIINDDGLRQGNANVDSIYIYWEGTSTIHNVWTKFAFEDGTTYPATESIYYYAYTRVQTQVPYSAKRDLNYFEYGKTYNFVKIQVPNEVFAKKSSVLGNVYFVLNQSEPYQIQTLGKFAFNVEESVYAISVDKNINVAQWNQLMAQFVNVAEKQDKLISGVNIKTINSQNILGSGNLKVGTLDYETQEGTITSVLYDEENNRELYAEENQVQLTGYLGSTIQAQLKDLAGGNLYPKTRQEDITNLQVIKTASVSGNTLTLTKQDNTTVVYEGGTTYTAGSNVSIINNVINATDTKYQAGNGLGLAGTTFSVDTSVVQPKLTAGNNVSISGLNVISATDTTYSAGSNISISDGVISATDTTYAQGNGITISSGTISANVDNNLTSTSTTNALSAYQGKLLNDRIDNLLSVGKFLSIWNASNGSVLSEPPVSTYTYKVGDYYRVGTSGTKNPAPNLSYVVGGTNYVEGSALSVGDVIYCSTISESTTTWVVLSSGGAGSGTVQDVTLNGVSTLSGSVAVLSDVERSTNKVTSLGAGSTDTQYPSAKLVYDQLATKQASLDSTQLNAVNSGITSGKVSTYDGYASSKQDLLVSGTNIKTINSTSILGSGNITVAVEMEIFESGD